MLFTLYCPYMDYWLKQTKDTPLYPDLAWEKPEQRDQRGRLLIVGGNLHSFAAPAQAYGVALDRDVGYVRVIMPDALKKTVHKLLPDVEYAPSTQSGSFSNKSLEPILWHAQWANGILIPGDLGRNSETAVMLEKLVRSTVIPLTLTTEGESIYCRHSISPSKRHYEQGCTVLQLHVRH